MPLLNEVDLAARDTYHGIEIIDPFRWLEDRSHPRTEHWLKTQQDEAGKYFRKASAYEYSMNELSRRLDVEVLDEPVSLAGKEFCRLRRKGQQRASLYVREAGTTEWRTLLNAEGRDPSHSINLYRISSDGSLLAFLERVGGSDQASVHCIDVRTGSIFEAGLDRGYARGLVLSPPLQGFFYCHETPSGMENHQIRFSRLSAEGDQNLVFEQPRSYVSKLVLSGDEEYLGALYAYERDSQKLGAFWVSERGQTDTWRLVFEDLPATYTPLIRNKRLYLLNRELDGGFAISEFDLQGREVRRVASGASGDVRGIAITDTHLYVSLQHDMATEIQYWNLTTGLRGGITAGTGEVVRLLPSPIVGDAVFFTRESYAHPPVVFRNIEGVSSVFSLSLAETVMEKPILERTYRARDGVAIPATLIGQREGLVGQPVIILVYGSFGGSLLPQFSVLFHLLIEMGAVLAVLHVRGGGEKGRRWHDAGKRQNKSVSVSDVIDGIDWLRSEPFVDSNRIALYGASAGGLLVASVAMKVPEQLRAVVCIGPLLDMLRYDKFGLARRWKDEFGTSESSDDFDALLRYSPYHNVTSSPHRPAFLFVTGEEDDRCDPAHVRKMAALLMKTSREGQIVLVDYSASRGHTPGLPLKQRITTLARRCAFLATELDFDVRGTTRR